MLTFFFCSVYEVYQSVSGSHRLNKQNYLSVVFFRGDGAGWTREELLSLLDLIAEQASWSNRPARKRRRQVFS